MTPKKAAPASGTKKTGRTAKGARPHGTCPHCGQVKRGTSIPPHRPGGTRRHRAKRSTGSTGSTVDAPPAPAPSGVAPADPLDAGTVIRGIVQGMQEVLERASAADAAPAPALHGVVRRAVLEEFRTRARFAGRLAEIDAMLWSQPEHRDGVVSAAMETHLRELGLLRLTEPEASDRFVVTEGKGELFELLRPGYVDELTGKIILSGQLRRVERPGHTVEEGQA